MARKILIVQTAFLGDLLLSIPLIKRVRKLYPNCEVDLVCRQGLGEFFIFQHLVHRVFEIKKGDSQSYADALNAVKSNEYDVCLCPHQSIRSALFVMKVSAKVKIGFKKWWNFFVFNTREVRSLDLPDALRQLSLLRSLDKKLQEEIERFPKSDLLAKIPEEFSMKIEAQDILFRSEILHRIYATNFVLIAPGSQWATKRWTQDGFVDVAKFLAGPNLVVGLIGNGPEDASVNRKISERVPGAIDLTGKTTLNELASLMTKARVLICNDSGLMHLASAVGLQTVAIFGPTTLKLGYRPWQNGTRIVEKELFCRPCGPHGHNQCPLSTHECMKGISSFLVLSEFKKVYKDLNQKPLH